MKTSGAGRQMAAAKHRKLVVSWENWERRYEKRKRRITAPALLDRMQRRSKVLAVVAGLLMMILLGRAIALHTFDYYRTQNALLQANREPLSLKLLNEHIESLDAMALNIEKASLGDIKAALEKTIRLTNQASQEYKVQFNAWSELRGKIKNDGSTYNALRAQLNDLQKFQQEEILRLRELLNKAQQDSPWEYFWSIALSFFLGVLGSLFASKVYDEWKERKVLKASRPDRTAPRAVDS